jgi:hypothetical protein
MPKAKLNPLIEELRGAIDDLVFHVSPGGKIIVSRRPDMSRVQWSKAQKAHRERFKQATEYAKAAMADPRVHAVYKRRAAKARKRPYALALSDYFKGNDLLSKK